MTDQPKTGPRPSDKWIPWYFVLFFVALIATLVPMGYIAVHTMPGVVTEHAYEKGLAYNKAIAAGAEEQALGWQGEVAVAGASGGEVATYVLRDAAGQAIDGAEVKIWAVRPAQGGMDRAAVMSYVGGGRYEAALPLPARGLWDLRVSATRDGHNFQNEKRIVLP